MPCRWNGTVFTLAAPMAGKALARRIFDEQHLNPVFRADRPEKALYAAMAQPGTQTWFVPLSIFKSTVDSGFILFVDGVFTLVIFRNMEGVR